MQPVVYDVAVSIDGYISGANGDISQFPHEGKMVEDYFARLQNYSVVIMGKNTYEFGYDYGLKAGENPYPHLDCYVVSKSLKLGNDAAVKLISDDLRSQLNYIKERAKKPIYLCGGGSLAAQLFELKLIDQLNIKRAPILLGSGTKITDHFTNKVKLTLIDETHHQYGALFQSYKVSY